MRALLELLGATRRRLAALARRERLDRDLDEELAFHLAMRERDYRAAGLPAEAARRAAVHRLGNPVSLKQACRETWSFVTLETLWQDARLAVRVLLRSPGFTAVALLSLALGTSGTAAMFSLVSAVLLRPLPYAEADRLVRLTGFYPKGAVAALQELSRTMDVAGATTDVELNLSGQGEPARLVGSAVSANLFSLLGRLAALGRAFAEGEDRPGRDRIVLLSHALWRNRFGSDPGVVGRTVRVEGVERQVVGVLPADFHFPSAGTQLWIPLRLDPGQAEDYWGFGWMPVVARLRPGATLGVAHEELLALVARIANMFPWPAATWNPDAAAVRLQQDLVKDVRGRLLVLQAAVAIVLLGACANVAGLLLARAAGRRKEMALRAALGASRGRILRQLLTEGVVLSLAGGALGVGLAHAALAGWRALVPVEVRGFSRVGLDGSVLAFVTSLALACGLLFGLAPALRGSRVELAAAIRGGGQRASGPAGARLRSAFVAAQVALAVVLTVGAGLLTRTLWRLLRADPGFRSERTLSARISPNPSACRERAACVAFYEALLRHARETSGVAEVALASSVPLGGREPLLPVEMEGHPIVANQSVAPLLWAGAVTPSYFGLMRIPLLRGRVFDDSDAERTASVVVVSAATARRYWPGQDPLGRRVRVVWDEDWRTVVGVVGDVRQYALSGRTPAVITGALYMPYPQSVALDRRIPTAMTLMVRSSWPAGEVAARMRALVSRVDPELPLSEVRSLGAVVASSVREPRSMMWLFAGFAACALLLAAIGTYGVVSYGAAQRTYEIGVRVAIGVSRASILGLVLGHSLRLVAIGLAIGVAAAPLATRALTSFLYGVEATDFVTFAGVCGVLVATALVAGYLPARRAAGTDPVRALRVE